MHISIEVFWGEFQAVSSIKNFLKPLLRPVLRPLYIRLAGYAFLRDSVDSTSPDVLSQISETDESLADLEVSSSDRKGQQLAVLPQSQKVSARIQQNNHVAQHWKSTKSQSGEEGICDFIFEKLGIDNGWVVEFGAFDGERDLNCWVLLNERNWHGVLIEPMDTGFELMDKLYQDREDVHCIHSLVGWEGENTLDKILTKTPIPQDFELLTIDIDGNDYYVWEAVEKYSPKVVIFEVNPVIPNTVEFIQPKDPELHHQSSLLAVYNLAKSKGYELVCVTGVNAIFVRKEYYALFDVPDNHPTGMYQYPHEMKLFQLYNGELVLSGSEYLMWQSQRMENGEVLSIPITHEDIQPLPTGLRVFRPRHTYSAPILEAAAGQLDPQLVPNNGLLSKQRSVTSENGEDGIIEHIFSVIQQMDPAHLGSGYFVDIGANDGKYLSNVWALAKLKGWGGLLVESEPKAFEELSKEFADMPGITCQHTIVDSKGPNTIDSILAEAGAPSEIDFLSIDVEGNDYHLWDSLKNYQPRMVVIDFNPSVPNDVVFIQEEGPQIHHGSSLRALVGLAQEKGYGLAAATSWNAIFVRLDFFQHLGVDSSDLDLMYYPPFEMKAFQTMHGTLFIRGCDTLVRQNWKIDQDRIQVIPPDLATVSVAYEDFGKMRTVFYE